MGAKSRRLAFAFEPILSITAVNSRPKASAMTIRVPLDGDNWAEVKGPDDLTGADIDDYEEFLEKVREDALGPQLPPEPDPENPAVMKTPERKGSFTAAHIHQIRDKTLSLVITAWSYDLPVPYTAEARHSLPGRACRMLDKAADPAGKVLNNSEEEDEPDPKPESDSTGISGSSGTSPESTLSPLPASRLAPSATAPG